MVGFIVCMIIAILILNDIQKRNNSKPKKKKSNSLKFDNFLKAQEEAEQIKFDKFPYFKKDLMSKGELNFFNQFQERIADKDYVLLAKVRIADLIGVSRKINDWKGYFWKISQKHVDFVLCKKDSLEVVAIIDLDDSSHEREDRQERDELVNDVLKRCGYKIIRRKYKDTYDFDAIAEQIKS
jgi:very-short-patch-repair endonuclease